MLAAHGNHLESLQFLVKTCNLAVNRQSKEGFTALWLASEHGHLRIVQYLIEECQANPHLTPKVLWAFCLFLFLLDKTSLSLSLPLPQNNILPVQIAMTKHHQGVAQYLMMKMQQFPTEYYNSLTETKVVATTVSGKVEEESVASTGSVSNDISMMTSIDNNTQKEEAIGETMDEVVGNLEIESTTAPIADDQIVDDSISVMDDNAISQVNRSSDDRSVTVEGEGVESSASKSNDQHVEPPAEEVASTTVDIPLNLEDSMTDTKKTAPVPVVFSTDDNIQPIVDEMDCAAEMTQKVAEVVIDNRVHFSKSTLVMICLVWILSIIMAFMFGMLFGKKYV